MLFVTNVTQKFFTKKTKPFFPPPLLIDLKQKYTNCIKQNKEFLSIIVQFWGVAK